MKLSEFWHNQVVEGRMSWESPEMLVMCRLQEDQAEHPCYDSVVYLCELCHELITVFFSNSNIYDCRGRMLSIDTLPRICTQCGQTALHQLYQYQRYIRGGEVVAHIHELWQNAKINRVK
jgi:hypothetical protein